MPVGAPGGPRRKGFRGRSRRNPAKAAEYRHSEKGMMAKQMRDQNPQHRAMAKARRDAKRKMKAGF